MDFASTWNKLQKHCISAESLLVEGYVQGAVVMELCIAPFVQGFKAAIWESLNDEFCQNFEKFT